MKNKFKENWEKVDERCNSCNHITKEQKGLTKQNLKKLFRRPTLQDTAIFIMLILCMTLAWFYARDIQIYKAPFEDPSEFCQVYYMNIMASDWQNKSDSIEIPTFAGWENPPNENG